METQAEPEEITVCPLWGINLKQTRHEVGRGMNAMKSKRQESRNAGWFYSMLGWHTARHKVTPFVQFIHQTNQKVLVEIFAKKMQWIMD